MTRDDRRVARESRLEARRAEREVASRQLSSPPPQRLTRKVTEQDTLKKPCGCTRSKG